MKFIVNSSALLKQISSINGVITTNPVVPILENFLFEINDGILTVTASDLQTSIITEIAVESKETGSIAVPAKILLDTLKTPFQPSQRFLCCQTAATDDGLATNVVRLWAAHEIDGVSSFFRCTGTSQWDHPLKTFYDLEWHANSSFLSSINLDDHFFFSRLGKSGFDKTESDTIDIDFEATPFFGQGFCKTEHTGLHG